MNELKKKLQEEVNRYNAINKYAINLMEQAVPPTPPPTGEEPLPGGAPPPPAAGDAGVPPPAGGDAGAPPTGDAGAPPSEDTSAPLSPEGDDVPEPSADDSTENIDVTELVNMTKNIKQELENNKTDNSGVSQKMDGVFSKLSELEGKLAQMDGIIAKIDELGAKIEQSKPPTPVEKLEMRSLDSAPFNEKPQEFFAKKQDEMKASGKNEYVLTKDDVLNYNKEDIKKSFNDRLDDNQPEY